jgi:hypothetical protein
MFPFLLVPLALALGIAAHETHAAPATPAERAAADSAAVADARKPAIIMFENQGWDLATVYAVPRSGLAVRLGQVTPGATARLVVPRSVVTAGSSVDIVAVPLARNFAIRSGPVTIYPGDALRASIPASQNLISVLPAR